MKSQGHSDVSAAMQSISECASGNDGDASDAFRVQTGINISIIMDTIILRLNTIKLFSLSFNYY